MIRECYPVISGHLLTVLYVRDPIAGPEVLRVWAFRHGRSREITGHVLGRQRLLDAITGAVDLEDADLFRDWQNDLDITREEDDTLRSDAQ